ncbi:uncharacterized protein LOC124315950 isoform X2 [Daphnia pulicaria]|uniref:uncharacterized protein LOC124315950 isoform X2 n=1 Tax=Daphnia pulicaria TaxID=35523 RepID=UPI001EEA1CEC|nr:uncharacterized protein LOC124315950 isoform X2 [Daphnia pulicaria]
MSCINTCSPKSFWSMIIDPNCMKKFTVERSFHISKAVLDWPYPRDESPITRLMVDCDDKKGIILCELMKNDPEKSLKHEADLDVHFRVGQKITLYSEFVGIGVGGTPIRIHLSGYEFLV